MKVTVDCDVCRTKKSFLLEMQKVFEEMYGLNYDAFIDGARGIEQDLEIEVLNLACFEDGQNLAEIFKIIEEENRLIKFTVMR